MPDQKMSLEGILEQYSPKNEKPKTTVGRVDAQKIINSTIESPDLLHREAAPPPISHEQYSC